MTELTALSEYRISLVNKIYASICDRLGHAASQQWIRTRKHPQFWGVTLHQLVQIGDIQKLDEFWYCLEHGQIPVLKAIEITGAG